MIIETILSPSLIKHADLAGKTAVIIDVLRATSTMCVALNAGATEIIPTASPEECLNYRSLGYLCAAERNGLKLDGFDMGNSPEDFSIDKVSNKKIAMTTTNGTATLLACQNANRILIGSFLNLSALCNTLEKEGAPFVLVCSGWKGKVNIEDTLFAGAVAHKLRSSTSGDCDSTLIAAELWRQYEKKPELLVERASHSQRFYRLGIDDLPQCLAIDAAPVVPCYHNKKITLNIELSL